MVNHVTKDHVNKHIIDYVIEDHNNQDHVIMESYVKNCINR